MREVTGNLWTYPADVRVITTNDTIKKDGTCVMGRGCAAEAKQRPEYSHYNIARMLGQKLLEHGNHVHYLGTPSNLYSFPVKHHWHAKADINLIVRSATELRHEIDELQAKLNRLITVVLPRPGCGNGGLTWCSCNPRPHPDDPSMCGGVKHIIAPILDNRFHVITFDPRKLR